MHACIRLIKSFTMMIRRVLVPLATFSSVAALSTVAPSRTGTLVLEALKLTPLVRASDDQLLTLPSLWRRNTLAGLGDEVAVTAFLRHFG